MNSRAVLALPKTAGSAQTHQIMSFIWIVWSTLYVYLCFQHQNYFCLLLLWVLNPGSLNNNLLTLKNKMQKYNLCPAIIIISVIIVEGSLGVGVNYISKPSQHLPISGHPQISWYPLDYKLHCVLLLFNKCEKWPGVTQLSPHHPAIYELYCKCFWSKNLQRWPFLVWRSQNPKNTAFYSSLINNSLKHRVWTATHCRHMPVYHGHKPVLLSKWPLLQVC